MYFLNVVKANIIMQYRNYFFNKSIYLSLLVWPLIMFINAYYSYIPFKQQVMLEKLGVSSYEEVYIFLFIGFVAMMFFWSLVQSAWQSAFAMRISGTLELLYMLPGSRFGALLGNSIASLIGSIWMIIVFTFGIFLFYKGNINLNITSTIISFLLLIFLALAWGVFLNSLFLICRDGGFIYTILESPMEIFSGVKIPFNLMPLWARMIGFIFPLTYIMAILRLAILHNTQPRNLVSYWLICIFIIVILTIAAYLFIIIGEKNAKKTGSATLF